MHIGGRACLAHWLGREDVYPGRAQVHRRGAVVRKAGQRVVLIGGCDDDHVREAVGGRVKPGGIVVGAVVSGGRAKDNAGIAGGLNRGNLGAIRAAAPERGIDGHDVNAASLHHGRVLEGFDFGRVKDGTAIVGNFERHDPGLAVHSYDAQEIIAGRRDRAGNVGSVKAGVLGIGDITGEIIAEKIVHITVAIIIDAVVGYFSRVRPHVRRQIRVRIVHARIHYCHHHLISCRAGQAPGRHKPDVIPGSSRRPVG